jgi:hypothetical protein
MSFNQASKTVGREPIELVNIETDACGLYFGVGACNATGEPCYNTWATCRAKAAYSQTIKTYVFASPSAALPVGFSCIPLVQSVAYASQVLTPAKGLGVRGAVTVRFTDTDWPDIADDPYHAMRPAGIDGRGSFWPRFRARHKYYVGRFLHVKTGYIVNGWIDPDNIETRSYVIESIQGPDKNGIVTVTAKDILKLADDTRAQCPIANTARLDSDITDTATSLTVYPAGIGDAEFGPFGLIRIGSELLTFTRFGDVFNVVRGQYNTVAKSAKADDAIQLCAVFINEPVQNLIYQLLVNYAKVPAAYIDKTAWDIERDANLLGVYSAVITDPVGVNTLISELSEQGQCYIWWDETAQKIRFKSLVAPPDNLPVLSDEDHFLMGSVQSGEATDLRQSRFLIRFDQRDPTKKLDDVTNYRQRWLAADLQSEGMHEHGSSRTRIINSRWFSSGSLGRVQQLGAALLSRYRDPPRTLDASLDASDAIKAGALFAASSRVYQSASGVRVVVPMQIIESRYTQAATTVQIKAHELIWTGSDVPVDPIILIGADIFDVNLRDLYESEYGTPTAGQNITFIVQSDVLITATSTAGFALQTGLWPSVDLTLINNGYIAGRGGNGGWRGGGDGSLSRGGNGGNGLTATYQISIINNGVIAGGGGGGGAGYVGGSGGAPLGAGGAGVGPDESTDRTYGNDGGRLTGGAAYRYVPAMDGPDWAKSGGTGGNFAMAGGNVEGFLGSSFTVIGTGGAGGIAIVDPASLITMINNGQILGV